jgi:NADH-quinone oxidoreductase subunit C
MSVPPGGSSADTVPAMLPTDAWLETVRSARAEGYDYFDHLSASDEGEGRIAVVVHLWNRGHRRHRFLRTVTDDGHLASLADVFAGAGWHEREAAEMFGLTFDGAPDRRPLLLADGFAGHPLRKDFPLASRGTVDWPGGHEPNEHGPAARPPARRRPVAPGVPDWAGADRAAPAADRTPGPAGAGADGRADG